MPLRLVTPPSPEPVTLDEAKEWIKLESSITEDDALITGLISTARGHVEEYTHRALIDQQWELTLDSFPVSRIIPLPKGRLESVDTFQYVDRDGATQTVPGTSYRIVTTNDQGGSIVLEENESWPDDCRNLTEDVSITFTAGYGTAASDVPDALLIGIKLLVAHLYDRREMTTVGVNVTRVPNSFEWFVGPYRVPMLA